MIHRYRCSYATEKTVTSDVINPQHYKVNGLECIDVIEALGFDFCLGNMLKYVWRAGRKDGVSTLEDCRKAQWYLSRHISKLEKNNADS